MGEWEGKRRGKGTENKKHKCKHKIERGRLRIVYGNGEAKELICTTHGHELRGGRECWRGASGWRGTKGRKKIRQL